jgi:hypothetical protein
MMPLFAGSIYVDMPVLMVVVALVYSATRHDNWAQILKEAGRWLVHIVLFLGSVGVGLAILSKWF